MHKDSSSHWLRVISGMAFCAVALAVFAQASTKERVRAELIRLQKQIGLSLVWFEHGGHSGTLSVVVFANRSFSERRVLKEENVGEGAVTSDGTEIAFELRRKTEQTFSAPSGTKFARAYLAIIGQDGADLREYPDFGEPYGPCWSFDKSALALSVKNLKQGKDAARSLQVLNLGSGTTEMVDAKGHVTAQCWSPNGKQIVYQANQTLRVYDIQDKKSWTLTNGWDATWSPDGNWIAFLESDGYYAIRPSGSEKILLFKKKDALTALWWSPDSRFVAYVSRNRFFEGPWWPPIEQGRLRVRRLEDNAEDWVANLYVEGPVPDFQWVKSMELTTHAELIFPRCSLPDKTRFPDK